MENPEAIKKQIANILNIQESLLIYEERKDKSGKLVLDLITISPNPHQTRFLFHSVSADNSNAAFQAMLEYVNKHMKEQDTFQIRWHNPKSRNVEVSWFRASDIMEALNKFFHDKEVAEYKIYEVSLRPYA